MDAEAEVCLCDALKRVARNRQLFSPGHGLGIDPGRFPRILQFTTTPSFDTRGMSKTLI